MLNPGQRFTFEVDGRPAIGTVLSNRKAIWIILTGVGSSIQTGRTPTDVSVIGNREQDVTIGHNSSADFTLHMMLLAVEVSHDLRS